MSSDILTQTLAQLSAGIDVNRNISPEVKKALSEGAPISFRCAGFIALSDSSYVDNGHVLINVGTPSEFCLFHFLRQELERRHDDAGKQVGKLLTLLSLEEYPAWAQPYDVNIKSLLSGMSILSMGEADPDILELYTQRWGVEYQNIGQNTPTASHRAREYIDLTTDNPINCDYVWACNVVANGGNYGGDMAVSETLTALVQMLKPRTGRLLCVNSFDDNGSHTSLWDREFHTAIHAHEVDLQKNPDIFAFTRTNEEVVTPLEFKRAYQLFAERVGLDRDYTWDR